MCLSNILCDRIENTNINTFCCILRYNGNFRKSISNRLELWFELVAFFYEMLILLDQPLTHKLLYLADFFMEMSEMSLSLYGEKK